MPRCSHLLLITLSFAASSASSQERRDASLLTAENYAKITSGMTTDEVKAILGKPNSGRGQKNDWTSTWHNADRSEKIEVHFKELKVDRKSSTFAWAKPLNEPQVKQPEPKPDSKLEELKRGLRSADDKQRSKALAAIAALPYDEARAAEVSRLLVAHLRDKDEKAVATARKGLQRWVHPDSADYFLRVLGHKPKTLSPSDADREELHFAIAMLVKLEEPRAVEPLCKILDWHLFDRSEAEDALEALGPDIAKETLLKEAHQGTPLKQKAIAGILAKFKVTPGEELPQLLSQLKAENPQERYRAAMALAAMKVVEERRAEVAKELAALLDDHPGALADDLKAAEARAKKQDINSLTALMQEQEKHPANAALFALRTWGGIETEPAVAPLLASKIIDIRSGAARVLEHCGTARSAAALQKAKAAEPFNEVARYCDAALAAIQARGK
jgi:hypothetical protein